MQMLKQCVREETAVVLACVTYFFLLHVPLL